MIELFIFFLVSVIIPSTFFMMGYSIGKRDGEDIGYRNGRADGYEQSLIDEFRREKSE